MKRKIILDIVMTFIMVCLLNTSFTGLLLHELFGIGVFFLFAFHKLLNFKWIKAVTRKIFNRSAKPRTRLLYAVDVLLLLLATANVLTGILISTRILTFISAGDIFFTSQLHRILAYSLSLVLTIHIGLHWPYICKGMNIPRDSLTEKLLCGVIAATLALVLMTSNTVKKFLIPPQTPEFTYPAQMEVPPYKEEEEEKDEDPDDESTDAPEEIPSEPDIPTLEQFLSNLICTGCGRRCLLSNPGCGTGRRQQEEAVQNYNLTYSTAETYTTGDGYDNHGGYGDYDWDWSDNDYESDSNGEGQENSRPQRPGRGHH